MCCCFRNEDPKIDDRVISLMESGNRRKITQTKTIDYSDLECKSVRKGSADSLTSQRSVESHSSDSHSGITIRESSTKQESLQKTWQSTSTTSETLSDSGVSATPIITEQNYDNFLDSSPSVHDNFKVSTPITNSQRPSPRGSRCGTGFNNLQSIPPVRKPKDQVYPYDKSPNKTEQILGRPEAPIRKPRNVKRTQVKSLGEEVTDSTRITNALPAIDEAKASHRLPELKASVTPKRQRHNIPNMDLKRRNSDPATKLTINDHPGGLDSSSLLPFKNDYKSVDMNAVEMGGHIFRKVQKQLKDDDTCTCCKDQIDTFSKQGYQCKTCRKLVHTKCIQNQRVLDVPCNPQKSTQDIGKSGRRKTRKHSRTPYDSPKPEDSNFNLTRTSEFTDREDRIISGPEEMELMTQFITVKIMHIDMNSKKSSDVDRLFKQALREFKDNLVAIYSVKHGFDGFNVKYKDLIEIFCKSMDTVCQRDEQSNQCMDFPVTMGVNAFRGYMNEFMSSRAEEKPSKVKRKKEKKRKIESIKYNNHTFLLTIINIPTACEICSSFFMWPLERGLVCQSCKLTCHKKCYTNSIKCRDSSANKKVFGVELGRLVTEESKIPSVIERLLKQIEIHGLYTEGIYRKSGVSSKIKDLKMKMEDSPEDVDFSKYQVHVLSSVFKSFLREMPEPLLTYDCYENFITAANLPNESDRISTLYDILKKLPPPNYDLMERLMFHLARIAQHENVNRMSPASLAIVFAPCVLRTNKLVPAQDCLLDINSQTQCIETIIKAQLTKVKATLDDIDTLQTACQAATNRLSSLRSSKVPQSNTHCSIVPSENRFQVFSPEELCPASQQSQSTEEEETLLVDHINEIQKEKEHLTSTLPTLTHATSDDDMLSTDGDGSLDDLTSIGAGEQKRARAPVVRSISSSEPRTSAPPRLTTQLSSDVTGSQVVEDAEDPIMV